MKQTYLLINFRRKNKTHNVLASVVALQLSFSCFPFKHIIYRPLKNQKWMWKCHGKIKIKNCHKIERALRLGKICTPNWIIENANNNNFWARLILIVNVVWPIMLKFKFSYSMMLFISGFKIQITVVNNVCPLTVVRTQFVTTITDPRLIFRNIFHCSRNW